MANGASPYAGMSKADLVAELEAADERIEELQIFVADFHSQADEILPDAEEEDDEEAAS